MNNSPWIEELEYKKREALKNNADADIVIIGGGISGISTAFFVLHNSKKKVILIEGGRIAHGATGHNAGQVVDYFERPFSDIVKEYGLKKAIEGQEAISSGWDLLDEMIKTSNIDIRFDKFIGYMGFTGRDRLILQLENRYDRKKAKLHLEEALVREDHVKSIPKKYKGLYTSATLQQIKDKLETSNEEFIAAFGLKKGLINSALFTHKILDYMEKKFEGRLLVFEDTRANEIILEKDKSIIRVGRKSIFSERVIMCTNGFRNITITNKSGSDLIDTKFHHHVHGLVGYMAGYLEEYMRKPNAISYFEDKKLKKDIAKTNYFYLTRRVYNYKKIPHMLVCVGGPDAKIKDSNFYKKDAQYPKNAQKDINIFLRKNYKHSPKDRVDFKFIWHGLMGYTKNALRLIGEEPCNKNLLYNLGCNGVGILPSVYGAYKVSKIISGKKFPPSIFDPFENECKV